MPTRHAPQPRRRAQTALAAVRAHPEPTRRPASPTPSNATPAPRSTPGCGAGTRPAGSPAAPAPPTPPTSTTPSRSPTTASPSPATSDPCAATTTGSSTRSDWALEQPPRGRSCGPPPPGPSTSSNPTPSSHPRHRATPTRTGTSRCSTPTPSTNPAVEPAAGPAREDQRRRLPHRHQDRPTRTPPTGRAAEPLRRRTTVLMASGRDGRVHFPDQDLCVAGGGDPLPPVAVNRTASPAPSSPTPSRSTAPSVTKTCRYGASGSSIGARAGPGPRASPRTCSDADRGGRRTSSCRTPPVRAARTAVRGRSRVVRSRG